MSDFFQSEMVRGDIQEMTDLQMYCVRASTMLPALSPIKLNEYYDVLIQLIEKQKTFYFRMKLSEDEEAKMMVEMMKDFTYQFAGTDDEGNPSVPEGTPLEEVFDTLVERVKVQKESIAPYVEEQIRLQEDD